VVAVSSPKPQNPMCVFGLSVSVRVGQDGGVSSNVYSLGVLI
jgi:hypothetical protein